jgi:putative ABC transport system permease protein
VRQIDPALPLRRVQPLSTFLDESLAPERFRTTVLGVIVLLGLVLAALGIYGVTYRGVVDRTREFAIRLALGSERPGVLRMVMAESLKDVAAGLAMGVVAGIVLCGALERLVEHVGPASTGTTAASVAVLLVAAVIATLVPAVRVLRVNPAEALRGQ